MLSEILVVCVVVYAPDTGEAETLRQVLTASGVSNVRVVKTADQFLMLCAEVQPDVAILGLGPDLAAAVGLIKQVRAGARGVNRFLPIIAAKQNPSTALVHAAIDSGTHEFLLLPASVKSLSTHIYRAVFISRPFIAEPAYAGPCRRRRPGAYSGPDRRSVPWPGYVHAAHKAQTAEAH